MKCRFADPGSRVCNAPLSRCIAHGMTRRVDYRDLKVL
jgi:hypothetical protein